MRNTNSKVIVVTAIGTLIVVTGLAVAAFAIRSRSSQTRAFGPGYGPMMSGAPFAPEGYTPPSGGSGGLAAVTADGTTIPAPSDAPELPENTATQNVGNLSVTLAISPYPPTSFQSGTFDITLTDDQGQPVTDAEISLDLSMPGMWMPPSKPEAENVGNGEYEASAFWTMRGLWRIEVVIERGGETLSAFFDVWL